MPAVCSLGFCFSACLSFISHTNPPPQPVRFAGGVKTQGYAPRFLPPGYTHTLRAFAVCRRNQSQVHCLPPLWVRQVIKWLFPWARSSLAPANVPLSASTPPPPPWLSEDLKSAARDCGRSRRGSGETDLIYQVCALPWFHDDTPSLFFHQDN